MAAIVFSELECSGCRLEILRGEFRLFRCFLKRREFSFGMPKQIERMTIESGEVDSVLQNYIVERLYR